MEFYFGIAIVGGLLYAIGHFGGKTARKEALKRGVTHQEIAQAEHEGQQLAADILSTW